MWTAILALFTSHSSETIIKVVLVCLALIGIFIFVAGNITYQDSNTTLLDVSGTTFIDGIWSFFTDAWNVLVDFIIP